MASFTERIAVIIDVTADKATKGLKDFKSSVQEAEGFTGKMKAGVGSLGGIFSSAAKNPALLAGGIAAAGTAAIKAVDEFAQLALSAGKFSDASGLAIEDASRWMEVSGDLGVSTESLSGAINKMNRSIDPKLFHDLGIEIAKTDTGATDVNGTFLNVIQHLHDIPDPAQRAREATKLIGKGWVDMAELIQRGSAVLTSSLAGVSDAQVINPEERKKAELYRETMDQVGDSVKEIALTMGQLLLPALVLIAKASEKVLKPVSDTVGDLEQFGDDLLKPFMTTVEEKAQAAAKAQTNLNDAFREGSRIVSDHSDNVEILSAAETDAADEAYNLAQKTQAAADVAAEFARRFSEARQKLKDLQDEISGRKSLVDLKLSLKANADKLGELKEKFEKGKISAEDYYLEVQSLALDSEGAVASYAEAIGNIPPEAVTDIVTNLDPSAPEKVFDTLQQWFDNHKLMVTVGGMVVDSGIRNAMEGRGIPAPPTTPTNTPPAGSVDDVAGNGNRSLGAGRPMVIQLQVNDRTVQEIAIRADQLKVGRT